MKNTLQRYIFIIAISFLSTQAYAVKPFTVTCGDGTKIEVADSEYSPNGIARACFTAGHEPPKKSTPRKIKKMDLTSEKASKSTKIFRSNELKKAIAKSTGASPADVDHTDIILMLQGCECISPSCVAYLCPIDVDIP